MGEDSGRRTIDDIRCPKIKGLPRDTVIMLRHTMVQITLMRRRIGVDDLEQDAIALGWGGSDQQANLHLGEDALCQIRPAVGRIRTDLDDGASVERRVADALAVAEEAFDAQHVLAPGCLRHFGSQDIKGIPNILDGVLSLRVDAGANDPVFASRNGGGLAERTVNDMVKRAAAEAGIDGPVSPHWLRHAHGSHAIDRGATLPEVQNTLGHDNIATTSGYFHARPDSSSGLKLDPGVFLR